MLTSGGVRSFADPSLPGCRTCVMAQLLSGTEVAKEVRNGLAEEVKQLVANGVQPRLVIVQVREGQSRLHIVTGG